MNTEEELVTEAMNRAIPTEMNMVEDLEIQLMARNQALASAYAELHQANLDKVLLLNALQHAAELVADWGGYASDYFQEKHDLQYDVAMLHEILHSFEGFEYEDDHIGESDTL